jgi:hypothetical protein
MGQAGLMIKKYKSIQVSVLSLTGSMGDAVRGQEAPLFRPKEKVKGDEPPGKLMRINGRLERVIERVVQVDVRLMAPVTKARKKVMSDSSDSDDEEDDTPLNLWGNLQNPDNIKQLHFGNSALPNDGRSPALWSAVQRRKAPVGLHRRLYNICNVDANTPDPSGQVRKLFNDWPREFWADFLNFKDEEGDTAFHLACFWGFRLTMEEMRIRLSVVQFEYKMCAINMVSLWHMPFSDGILTSNSIFFDCVVVSCSAWQLTHPRGVPKRAFEYRGLVDRPRARNGGKSLKEKQL